MIKKLGGKYREELYLIFRVLVGLMFAAHGAQKLFGMFGGSKAELLSFMGLIGTIEFLVGIAIAIGLYTVIAAGLGAIVMLRALFKVHFPTGWMPLQNGGELALLYLVAFLVLMGYGAGKYRIGKH